MNECGTVELCAWLACMVEIHMDKARGKRDEKKEGRILEHKDGFISIPD